MSELPAAVISEDGHYRYFLSRRWGSAPPVAFIGLNPSTADATFDDPTIRRCIGFAKAWGAGGLHMVNLFAYRSTDPDLLTHVADPVGPQTDEWIERALRDCEVTVAAWGNKGTLLGRAEWLRQTYPGRLSALRITRTGSPGHPLYIPATATPTAF